MITLINTAKTMQVFHLPRMAMKEGFKGVHYRTVKTDHNPKTGKIAQHEHRVSCPPTLTLLAGETRKDLPNIVGTAPEILEAERRGFVKIHRPKRVRIEKKAQ